MTQEEIIQETTGYYPQVGRKYLSPFREDRNPTCFFAIKDGKWRWYDYAHRELNGADCFDLLCFRRFGHKVRNQSDLDLVRLDLPLAYSEKFEFELTWQRGELKPYWEQYGIDPEKDGVYGVEWFRYNTKQNPQLFYKVYPSDPTFAITCGDKVKIYRPTKERKHLTNFDRNSVLSLQGEGRTVIVTKSYKDGRVLANATGMPVKIIMSESVFPDDWVLSTWMADRFVIIFDNDKTGRENLLTFQNIMCRFAPAFGITPEGKDSAQMFLDGTLPRLIDKINLFK